MANSGISPFQVTKTLLGIKNELLNISDIAQDPILNTTLNYKYGVVSDLAPSKKPEIGYFGIGINGCRNVDDGNLSTPHIPSMHNMDLYTPIPFRCVPLDEDLTSIERALYRMRVRRTFNGKEYWCYYLKKITTSDTDVRITRTNPLTQAETEYELDINNLNPVPTIPVAGGLVTPEGSEVNVTLNYNLPIKGSEVIESVGIIYDDLRRATVSEIGIYTAEDKLITSVDSSNVSFNYVEAVYAQLAIHYCSIGFPLTTPNATKNVTLRLGKSNVMLL